MVWGLRTGGWRISPVVIMTCVVVLACTSTTSPATTTRSAPPSPHATAVSQPTVSLPALPVPKDQAPAIAGTAGCGTARDPGDYQESIGIDGWLRDYRVHLPLGYSASAPLPLVLNFHGSGRLAVEQESYSGLVPYSDREGFILVSPQAAGGVREWTIVGIYGDSGADDYQFTSSLLDTLEAAYCIDPSRIYATGMSNGAEMASEAGCRFPDRFAAIAPVAGALYDSCEPGAMPVISFHGTEDWNVPFDPIPSEMALWARHNGCADEPLLEQWTSSIDRLSYQDCAGGEVVLFVLAGGGHQWPGAMDETGGIGFLSREIDATALIWEFFSRNTKPR